MAEDIKPDVLKKTQTALNKYIKRPPLTEKLLRKPPFRFLHDIVTSVIKETGFLKEIFLPEELIADNVKDKDSKIKFLTKLINAVKDSTGNNLKAKPGKIVAGLEVDKTLELLQAIAKGIASQTNGNKSVITNQSENKSLKDDSGSIGTNNKSKPKTEENVSKKNSDVKDKKKKDRKKEDTSKKEAVNINDEKEKKKRDKSDRRENGEKLGKKEKSHNEELLGKRETSGIDGKPDNREKPEIEEKQTLKEVKWRESFPSEEDNIRDVSQVEKLEVDKNHENSGIAKEPEKINDGLNQAEVIPKEPSVETKTEEGSAESKEEEIVFRHKETEQKNKKQINELDNQKQSTGEAPSRRPSTRRSSSRSLKQPMKVISEKGDTGKDKEDSKTTEDVNVSTVANKKKIKNDVKDFNPPDTDIIRPPSAIERPRTARRAPPSARPPSVRPGAPKTRDRGEVAVDLNKDKENEAKEVVVIAENEKLEEDKENMVVMEPHHMVLDEENNIEDTNSSGAGVLVDILESIDGIEKQKQKSHTEIEWESGQKDKRASWQKECDQLKAGIQALTRSTGPLGKLFDFLQEDVDLAARELTYWKQACAEYTSQLQSEKRSTEELLSKHRKKLTELDGLIEEEQEAIRAVKSNILINDRKILSLISRVPTTQ